MIRNKYLFSAALAAAALLAPMPLLAVQVVQKGSEAQRLVQDDGYIIFIHADGWDEFSESRCQQLVADAAIRKAAGKAMLMLLPYPECADGARWQKQQEYLGGLKVPTPSSFPALIFLDREGCHYATLKGRVVANGSVAELSELVADRLSKGRERRRLLADAEQTPGSTRAGRLFSAYQIDGLTWMSKETTAAIRKADPNNETGVITALDFDAYGFASNIAKNGVAAGKAEVDKMLDNPAYTPRQKQQICPAARRGVRLSESCANGFQACAMSGAGIPPACRLNARPLRWRANCPSARRAPTPCALPTAGAEWRSWYTGVSSMMVSTRWRKTFTGVLPGMSIGRMSTRSPCPGC